MVFSSITYFLLFLPAAIAIYYLLSKTKRSNIQKIWLIAASLFFYGYWDYHYLYIMVSSILINYLLAYHINHLSSSKPKLFKKSLLISTIIFNLSLLVFYKYTDFIISNYNFFTSSRVNLLNIVLPLGISFFTFQQISFQIDNYKKNTYENDFLDYALYVSFFPQLIAGPIVLYEELKSQIQSKIIFNINYDNISKAIFIFTIGLSKKIIIADNLSLFVSNLYHIPHPNFFEAGFAAVGFGMQLYFDFSGYTDMALGSALFFNLVLPENFFTPYRSTNIQDFWRRWHATLGRFIRNYVYIPLGGSRVSEIRVNFNLLIIFILVGIWHGAGWLFLIWGLIHGCAMVAQRLFSKYSKIKIPTIVAWGITFLFVNAAWILFKSETLGQAIGIYKGLTGLNGIGFDILRYKTIIFAFVLSLLIPDSQWILGKYKTNMMVLIITILLFTFSFYYLFTEIGVNEFLYFQF